MLPIGAQNRPRLAIHSRRHSPLAAIADHAGAGVEGEAEIHPLARVALEGGENPRHGMGIGIDVGAGAFATIDAFITVEAAIAEALTGDGGER